MELSPGNEIAGFILFGLSFSWSVVNYNRFSENRIRLVQLLKLINYCLTVIVQARKCFEPGWLGREGHNAIFDFLSSFRGQHLLAHQRLQGQGANFWKVPHCSAENIFAQGLSLQRVEILRCFAFLICNPFLFEDNGRPSGIFIDATCSNHKSMANNATPTFQMRLKQMKCNI